MGKLKDKVEAWTEKTESGYHASDFAKTLDTVATYAQDGYDVVTNTVVLSLAKAWLGIGVWRPANTDPNGKWSDQFGSPSIFKNKKRKAEKIESTDTEFYGRDREETYIGDTDSAKYAQHLIESGRAIASFSEEQSAWLDRFTYERLWYLQLGDYYMPMSQTFSLRAKKKLNTSPLVDGIDIIQQTRKEAKTIDCTLRISLREHQTELQIVDVDNNIQQLSSFLNDLWESNAVFSIDNDMINNTFGVTHVIMSDYKFVPRAGMGTYTFEFSLMEVKYGENVLTFDLSEVDADTRREIID